MGESRQQMVLRVQDGTLKGDLAYEEGVVRRDPSAMLKIGDTYYVWYSKSYGPTQDLRET